MLVGLGDLGSVVLELLVREAGIGRIVVGSVTHDVARARCNLARLGAIAQGYDPQVAFVSLDLNDTDAVAATVQRESPDIVLTTATLQTWWLLDLLPEAQATLLKSAGFGVWLPAHLHLTIKLMTALSDAQYRGLVLTAPFPDVVNCVLGKLNLAPTCGIGNLAEVVSKLRLMAAHRLGAAPADLTIWLVAHHALERYALWGVTRDAMVAGGAGERPPWFLRIELDGADVTSELGDTGRDEGKDLLFSGLPLPSGRVIHFLTAATAVRLIRALCSTEKTLLHAPGPHGLPGGYPVWASASGVELAPIPGLSHEEAVEINERSHPFDGIDRIGEDGTVAFRPESAAVLREALGYDCVSLPPDEAEQRSSELTARFREFAVRHGVRV
jgi:hypothetical protein